MNNLIKLSLFVLLAYGNSFAEDVDKIRDRIHSVRKAIDSFNKIDNKEVSIVNKFKKMFINGKATGQLKAMYGDYSLLENGISDTYATAVGGILKYELASFNGFNAGFAFATSQDLRFVTGSVQNKKHNDEFSSSLGNYTQLSEAYLNYRYDAFNFRAGRQIIDTPLADSDDIRMIKNTFEAYVATYELNSLKFMAGNIQKWQGYDAGLDNDWSNTGKNGTNFMGFAYKDAIEFNVWYYNITGVTNAIYLEGGFEYHINHDMLFHTVAQYLNEDEIDNSLIEAEIYGAMAEFVVHGIGFNIAYNKSKKKAFKDSFSGFGGGILFTSMDTMILNEIIDDRDAEAVVSGLVYEFGNWNFLYAYGDFKGDKNSVGKKAHIIEQDIGFEYNINDEFALATLYVMQEDKETLLKSVNDWNRVQVMVKYGF